ncbi:insulinase family protein [Paenibacillus sp. MMS20-IR301]|uniref:M16 family metallopeptidase n=1 Tax=Paenibacillus sp. MMS20-IR301 TaxID=2895946 RepID=UPI0028EDA4D5|nr:insulinase family protein [Paenibacillus sp. MMS20-IR301]WNS40834.1 insulinase family protein [Paenibacillus sp. MMS20-IR301]
MKDRISTGTLGNGLTYGVRVTDLDTADVQLCLVLKTGSLQQRNEENGLAHMVEHMNMSFDKYGYYKESLEYAGYGVTDFDRTMYVLGCRNCRDSIQQCIAILGQIAKGSYLRMEYLEEIKQDIVEEIHSRNLAGKSKAEQEVFGHPFYQSRLPAGDAESVRNTNFARVTAFHKQWYTPDRMAVFVVGAVNPSDIEQGIAAALSGLSCADQSDYVPSELQSSGRYPSPQPGRITSVWLPAGNMNLLEIYIKYTDQPDLTLKSELVRNILAGQLDTVCGTGLRSVHCPVNFLAAMFINFINIQQFCKFRITYHSTALSTETITGIIKNAIYSIVNDPELESIVEQYKKMYAAYYSSSQFYSSLDVHSLLEECADHFILGSPLLSYELGMEQITDALNSIRYTEVRQAAELLLAEK